MHIQRITPSETWKQETPPPSVLSQWYRTTDVNGFPLQFCAQETDLHWHLTLISVLGSSNAYPKELCPSFEKLAEFLEPLIEIYKDVASDLITDGLKFDSQGDGFTQSTIYCPRFLTGTAAYVVVSKHESGDFIVASSGLYVSEDAKSLAHEVAEYLRSLHADTDKLGEAIADEAQSRLENFFLGFR